MGVGRKEARVRVSLWGGLVTAGLPVSSWIRFSMLGDNIGHFQAQEHFFQLPQGLVPGSMNLEIDLE